MTTSIEKIIMKKTLLGGGRRRYVKGKSFAPPFEADFEKQVLPMVETHPEYFDVLYARVTPGKDDLEDLKVDALQREADLKNEALLKKLESGKKGKK